MNELEPVPTSVDWPSLVAIAERQGIPVSRVDGRGDSHIIRTSAQLESEWEPDAPPVTEHPNAAAPIGAATTPSKENNR